jgi:hypothetical protein
MRCLIKDRCRIRGRVRHLALQQFSCFLLTRSGGYESGFAGRGWGGSPVPQRSNLEDVVFFLFGAHGENCRRDDHSEKYQCKNEIVDHWGGSPCGRLWPSLSNVAAGNENGTSHLGAIDCAESCRFGVFRMLLLKNRLAAAALGCADWWIDGWVISGRLRGWRRSG